MRLFEPLVRELQEETGFTDAAVTDNNVLERISKRHN
jgi:8-oxo-dGTP pyrophosphatase MutT (NUDIX family)